MAPHEQQQQHLSNEDNNTPSMMRAFWYALPIGAKMTFTKFVPWTKLVERFGMTTAAVFLSILVALLIKEATLVDKDNRSKKSVLYTIWILLFLSFCLFLALVISTIKIAKMLARGWIQHRQSAFKEAHVLFSERVASKRAIRRDDNKYDVFFPPSSTTTTQQNTSRCFIFLPGALVDHTAYAPVAAKLSDKGLVVVVMNLEPMRLAFDNMGAGPKDVLALKKDVSETVQGIHNITEWSIGGHSMGGHQTAQLVSDGSLVGFSKLVIWGQNHFMPGVQLQTTNAHDVSVLVVQASNDGFYTTSKKDIDAFQSCLPLPLDRQTSSSEEPRRPHTVYQVINGGNHAGFGHYGPQLWPRPDGKRTISLEDQQKQCVEVTAKFLLN